MLNLVLASSELLFGFLWLAQKLFFTYNFNKWFPDTLEVNISKLKYELVNCVFDSLSIAVCLYLRSN